MIGRLSIFKIEIPATERFGRIHTGDDRPGRLALDADETAEGDSVAARKTPDVPELDRLVAALGEGVRRFATGIYLLWYPIKDVGQIRAFKRRLAALDWAQGRGIAVGEVWDAPAGT